MYSHDNRVVITLDAGGTNLVFGAMQANKFIVEPITLPSHAENLDKCLATMVEGFQAVIDRLSEKPVAISFAFPGPADYPNGIIGGSLPGLFSGALITETLYSIPGIGYISYQSMVGGDIPFSMFYLVFMAVLTLLGNLISDILYAVVDPRVRIA